MKYPSFITCLALFALFSQSSKAHQATQPPYYNWQNYTAEENKKKPRSKIIPKIFFFGMIGAVVTSINIITVLSKEKSDPNNPLSSNQVLNQFESIYSSDPTNPFISGKALNGIDPNPKWASAPIPWIRQGDQLSLKWVNFRFGDVEPKWQESYKTKNSKIYKAENCKFSKEFLQVDMLDKEESNANSNVAFDSKDALNKLTFIFDSLKFTEQDIFFEKGAYSGAEKFNLQVAKSKLPEIINQLDSQKFTLKAELPQINKFLAWGTQPGTIENMNDDTKAIVKSIVANMFNIPHNCHATAGQLSLQIITLLNVETIHPQCAIGRLVLDILAMKNSYFETAVHAYTCYRIVNLPTSQQNQARHTAAEYGDHFPNYLRGVCKSHISLPAQQVAQQTEDEYEINLIKKALGHRDSTDEQIAEGFTKSLLHHFSPTSVVENIAIQLSAVIPDPNKDTDKRTEMDKKLKAEKHFSYADFFSLCETRNLHSKIFTMDEDFMPLRQDGNLVINKDIITTLMVDLKILCPV
ncbi:MAG: hypothetical protein AAF380_02270 [Bacteroidota bacterium]